MNREQKAAAIEEIAANIRESQAIFAVDYRGLSVPQASELRTQLRAADTKFSVVKNTLTERAADSADAAALKELLQGPTALAFVRGDAAAAAKALRDYAKATELLPFKGGLMDGQPLTAEDIGVIARLPSREVLYGQLVGMVAHPIAGLARTLNALIGGLAIALGQVQEQGLVPVAGTAAPAPAADDAPAETPSPEEASEAADAPNQPAPVEDAPAPAEVAEASAAAEEPPTQPAPDETTAVAEGGADETADAVPTEAGVEPTDADTEDADAGPAGDPEPAQPNQAEGADDESASA